MTLLALESFDAIATADLAAKGWPVVNGTAVVSSTRARTGGQSLRLTSSGGVENSSGRVMRSLGAGEHATVIIGGAVYRDDTVSGADKEYLLKFMSDSGATQHIIVIATPTGTVEVRRGTASGTLLGTSASVLSANTWHYIEAKVTLSDAAGVVEIKVDGTTALNLTGVDTKNAGTKTVIDAVQFAAGGANGNLVYWDDLYVLNAAGSVNNTFLGDTRVRCLLPNGNGNSSQLLGSDGNSTDNYLLVDEATPSTADYVGSATLDQKDTYAFGDLPDASGTIHGVQISAYATKTDAAARNLAIVTRSGGTDYDGSDVALALGTNAYVQQLRETDPATSAAWAIAAVNAAEFGAKVR